MGLAFWLVPRRREEPRQILTKLSFGDRDYSGSDFEVSRIPDSLDILHLEIGMSG